MTHITTIFQVRNDLTDGRYSIYTYWQKFVLAAVVSSCGQSSIHYLTTSQVNLGGGGGTP
jgi:hypothetical protein